MQSSLDYAFVFSLAGVAFAAGAICGFLFLTWVRAAARDGIEVWDGHFLPFEIWREHLDPRGRRQQPMNFPDVLMWDLCRVATFLRRRRNGQKPK